MRPICYNDMLAITRPLNANIYSDGTGEALATARNAAEKVYADKDATSDLCICYLNVT